MSITHEAIELREVTRDNLRAVLKLSVAPEQEKFVASNAHSIAEAHFDPNAWFRAIYAGEVPVLLLSFVPGDDGPEGFYNRLGFHRTGEEEDGEVYAALPL